MRQTKSIKNRKDKVYAIQRAVGVAAIGPKAVGFAN
jgi:hypothetical protein